MKKLFILISLGMSIITGCFDNTKFTTSDITYTTTYPIEFITDKLYGEFSTIKSIYPNGISINEYNLTEKQKNNYALEKTFVYNGLNDEVKVAVDFLNINEDINIIDAMKNTSYNYAIEELWLDPSNYLMIARNVKESLIDYENNVYTKETISKNYEDLKIKISELDVELTMIGKNASYKNIVVANEALRYLSKYKINVLSLDEKNEEADKNLSNAKKLAEKDEIIYLYKFKNYKLPENIQSFVNTYDIEVIDFDTMENLTEEQRKEEENYITIMNSNIDNIKKELLK